MIRENPTREPEWTKASVTEPDWAMPATPPRGRYGRDVADVRRRVRDQVDHAHAVGPDQRQAVLAGDPRDVGLHDRRGLARPPRPRHPG